MKSQKAKAPEAPDVKLVHRVSATGLHRLEVHSPKAEPKVGKWAAATSVAQLGDHRATMDHFGDMLPRHFKVTPVTVRVVTD